MLKQSQFKPKQTQFQTQKSIWEGKNIESQQIDSLKNPQSFSVLFTEKISSRNGAA
jgi:hypothetical protein